MTDNKRDLKLSSQKDWDAWLAVVRAKATGHKIWHLINPALEAKPLERIEPIRPTLSAMEGNDFAEQSTRYKIAMSEYKPDLQAYEKEQEAMAKMISHIYDTTTASNLTYIEKVEVHPWDLLRALKARLAPSDSARCLDLEQQYRRLIKGPSNRQNTEFWLDEYLKMYTLGKEYKIAELVDGKRAYRDFLHAIEKIAPTFAEMHEIVMDSTIVNFDTQLLTTIEKFRHHTRLREARNTKASTSNSAFAAAASSDEGNKENNNNNRPTSSRASSFRGGNQHAPPCICGSKHWFSECNYLNEERRPANWKPNEDIQKKVNDAMKDDNKRKQVERNIAKTKELKEKKAAEKVKTSTSASASTDDDTGVFTSYEGAFASQSSSYILQSSWILDHGAGTHVANDTMKHRFIKEKDCTNGATIMSGHGPLPIAAYGRIVIDVQKPSGKGTMTLINVAYVPNFMVNIVSGIILADKGLHFDTQHRHLYRNAVPIVLVARVESHYVLEDNTKLEGVETAFATSKTTSKVMRTGSTNDWHRLLAHANNEAIQHLPTAVEGVKVTNISEAVPTTNKCEECALSKAHRIISRSSEKSETSNKPFFRITYDLIEMTTALNRDQWISHIACSITDFHMVYTHPHKSQATDILIRAIHTIETRYGGKVVFVRTDGERSLGNEWNTFMASKGITLEPSAPNTPAQNGHSERMGGILTMKARAMRIQAGLPVYTWPWINQTAGYLMNRTPSKKHAWKTPFEMATGNKPNLAHLVQYGSKAYPIDRAIPRREKMRPKAHIGFLVGYDSTNIYLIWIPSQRKVIRTRDVIFDEDRSYMPHEIDAAQLISEPFLLDDTLNIPQSDFTKITEIESDSEEDLFELAPTGTMRNDQATNATKDTQEYLPSPAPTALEGSTSPTTSSEPTPSTHSESHAGPVLPTRAPPHYSRTLLDEDNILPEGSTRTRRRNPRRQAYYVALDEASTGGMQSYFGAFTASLHTASLKQNVRLHRDNLPSEPKYFHQMLRHP